MSYVGVLKGKSNTNHQHKCSKQNLAENKPNNPIQNSILNACHSCSTSRNISIKVPKIHLKTKIIKEIKLHVKDIKITQLQTSMVKKYSL